jgi:hypothetical protein
MTHSAPNGEVRVFVPMARRHFPGLMLPTTASRAFAREAGSSPTRPRAFAQRARGRSRRVAPARRCLSRPPKPFESPST